MYAHIVVPASAVQFLGQVKGDAFKVQKAVVIIFRNGPLR